MKIKLTDILGIEEEKEFTINNEEYVYKIINGKLFSRNYDSDKYWYSLLNLNSLADAEIKPFIPKPKLNEMQRKALEYFKMGNFDYIARDKGSYNNIYIYKTKPYQGDYGFMNDNNAFKSIPVDIFKDIVKPMECYKIDDLLKSEEEK